MQVLLGLLVFFFFQTTNMLLVPKSPPVCQIVLNSLVNTITLERGPNLFFKYFYFPFGPGLF